MILYRRNRQNSADSVPCIASSFMAPSLSVFRRLDTAHADMMAHWSASLSAERSGGSSAKDSTHVAGRLASPCPRKLAGQHGRCFDQVGAERSNKLVCHTRRGIKSHRPTSSLDRTTGNKQRAFSNLTGTQTGLCPNRSAGLAPAFLAVERPADQNVAVLLGCPPQRNLRYYHFLLRLHKALRSHVVTMLGAFTSPHPTGLSPSPLHRHQRRSHTCEATFVCQWTAAGVRCFSVGRSQQCGAPSAQLRRGSSSSNNSSRQRHRPRRHQPSEPRCTGAHAQYSVRRPTDLPAPGDNPRHCLQLAPLTSFPFTLHQLVFLKVRLGILQLLSMQRTTGQLWRFVRRTRFSHGPRTVRSQH